MAQIPVGPGRRVQPGRAPMSTIGGAEAGVASARAIERLGQVGEAVATDMMATEWRQQQEADHKAQQLAEAAARQQDMLKLQQTEDALRDAHDEVHQGITTGTIPKEDADKVWNERRTKIVGDSIQGFRPEAQDIARKNLEGLGLRLGNGVRKAVEARDRADVTVGIQQTLEFTQRQYKIDPAKATSQAMQTIEQLGPFSNFTPEQRQKLAQDWKEGTQYTTAFEAISAGRNDRKALDAATKLIGTLPDLDPQKRAALTDRAEAYRLHLDQQAELAAQRAQRDAERRMNQAKAEFDTFQTLADKGTILDPAYIDRVSKATAGTPYQAGVLQLAKQARETGGLAAQPLAQQQALLDAIDNEIATKGRTPELDKRRAQVAKVRDGSLADLKDDPLRAGQQRGVIQDLQPLNLSGGLPGILQQISRRVVQADDVGRWSGRAVSPLLANEADQVATMLAALPPVQRSASIATITQTIGSKQAQALAAQIDQKDKGLALAMASGASMTTAGRYTSELILRGQQAIKEKTVTVDPGRKKAMIDHIGDSLSGKLREDTIEAANMIYAGLMADGSGAGPEKAVTLAIGGQIVEHNGSRIPIGPEMTADTFKAKLAAIPAESIAKQAPGGEVQAGGHAMPLDQFIAGLGAAQLQPAGQNRYYVRAGGALVTGAGRKPIVIEVK